MTKETGAMIAPELESRRQQAVTELAGVIRSRYKSATFSVRPGMDDPEATYLVATVDVEDPDMVLDLVVDRLLELQLEKGLPINVLPIHTPERVAQTRQRLDQRRGAGVPLPIAPFT